MTSAAARTRTIIRNLNGDRDALEKAHATARLRAETASAILNKNHRAMFWTRVADGLSDHLAEA